jgi:hypothetical protein
MNSETARARFVAGPPEGALRRLRPLWFARGRNRPLGLCFVVLCLFVSSGAPVVALAQGSEARGASREPSKDDGAYKDLIEQALTEFKLKNWPEARVLFRRAHELNPNARTLRGQGVVSFEMRDYQQAVQHLSQALVDARQPLTDAQRSECEGLLSRARTFVGSYTLHLTPGSAQVTLDGAPLLRDHDGLVLVPFGDHTLRATADQHQEATLRIQVQGGERSELNLSLLPLASSPVAMAPGVTPAAETSVPVASLPASNTGAQPAAPTAPSTERRFRGGGLRYTYVAAGIGVLFGGAAVASWFVGQGKFDDLNARCDKRAAAGDPCQRDNTNTDGVKTYERLTNTSIGLAAVGAVATGVLLVLEWPRESKLADKNIAVNVGSQSVSLRGSF